jgi:hypothetical protein
MGATRTWVSGVGDDANPCSRTAPCKTFAGAISKTAVRGEIDTIDPGGFGAVTITKSITIDGGLGPGLGSILASGTTGVIINATTSDIVTLRNLSINGGTTGLTGIRILSAGTVIIENCAIFNFRGTGTADAGRGIRDARTGGGRLFVSNSMIWDNGDGAIVISAPAGSPRITATLSNVRLLGNRDGLVATSGATVMVNDSVISTNSGVGVSAQEPAGTVGDTEVNLEACVVSYNNIGVTVQTGTPTIRLSNTTVTGNATGIFVVGGSVRTFGTNRVAGNGSGDAIPAGGGIPLQ